MIETAADIAALSAFGKASQLNRLLRLDFPFGGAAGKLGAMRPDRCRAATHVRRAPP